MAATITRLRPSGIGEEPGEGRGQRDGEDRPALTVRLAWSSEAWKTFPEKGKERVAYRFRNVPNPVSRRAEPVAGLPRHGGRRHGEILWVRLFWNGVLRPC